ncbi:hypothetical protein ACFV1N_13110 [Streptosporangium canum]|uniref:hypothetical protein n=1 Tax=Streptosporangium canum TaxID=324952 RepID=UPI003684FF73
MADYDEEHLARLIAKAEEPHVQALVESWGPPTPDDLALVARVFGKTVTATPERPGCPDGT